MRNAPGVVILSQRVLAEIEQIVGRFARKDRYVSGSDLRRDAFAVARAARRAWQNPDDRPDRIALLDDAIDDLKLRIDLAHDVRAFKSFAEYEALYRLVHNLGQQCGAWRKRYPKSQNRVSHGSPGRAPILSARDASKGAHQ